MFQVASTTSRAGDVPPDDLASLQPGAVRSLHATMAISHRSYRIATMPEKAAPPYLSTIVRRVLPFPSLSIAMLKRAMSSRKGDCPVRFDLTAFRCLKRHSSCSKGHAIGKRSISGSFDPFDQRLDRCDIVLLSQTSIVPEVVVQLNPLTRLNANLTTLLTTQF
mgnify:CR=1 FL=1